jgi:thymidine kinase
MADNYITTVGMLDLIGGPMFSSKTTMLLGRLFSEAEIGLKVLYINHSSDDRSCGDFSTHNPLYKNSPVHEKVTFKVITKMFELVPLAENYDVIGIDEAQFFEDLYNGVQWLVEGLNKHVIVAGLNGSFKREQFGQFLQLEPLADTYVKLTAWCLECAKTKKRTAAPFTHKFAGGLSLKETGGIDKYIPVCRRCYTKLNIIL